MNDCEKWNYLRDIPSVDGWNDTIRILAKNLWTAARSADGHRSAPTRFAMLAQTVARDWIHQVSDTARTGGEDIAGLTREPREDDAVDALLRGTDDCDAKARLFVALCLSVGIPARVVPYWKSPAGVTTHEQFACPPGARLYHVAAEVCIDNAWVPVELTLSRARLGERGERVPVETATGKWKDA